MAFNLETASVEELKAMAYDTLGQIEMFQKNLQILNQAIVNKSKEPVEVKPTKQTSK
jgi:hypothetical protein